MNDLPIRSKIRSLYQPHKDAIEIFAIIDGCQLHPTKIESSPTDQLSIPFVSLTREQSQDLANQLWEAGFRPMASHGTAGQLAAMQSHLDDMRRIALKETPPLAESKSEDRRRF